MRLLHVFVPEKARLYIGKAQRGVEKRNERKEMLEGDIMMGSLLLDEGGFYVFSSFLKVPTHRAVYTAFSSLPFNPL